MRIIGILKYQRVTVLIDSGSTHNFLDVRIVTMLGLQPMTHDGVKVRVANGRWCLVRVDAGKLASSFKALTFTLISLFYLWEGVILC
jgi:hypothetical protein